MIATLQRPALHRDAEAILRTYAALAKQLTNIQKYPTLRLFTIPVTFHAIPSETAGSPAARLSLISAQAAMTEDKTYT